MSISEHTRLLPSRRAELVINPLGEGGRYVLKDPRTGTYFQLGAEEHFLLTQLDGRRTVVEIGRAYRERFGETLAEADFDDFIGLVREQGFLQGQSRERARPDKPPWAAHAPDEPRRHSLLSWRKALFDPDRLLSRLEPRLRFFWTRSFVVLSAGCIVAAAVLLWANRVELTSSFRAALHWETALLVWLTLFSVTLLHEFAHGLTCKHHGGEVHEIGLLMLLFIPCFYCNVSDAWLFRERVKRLWVTLAGGYFELFLWALSVFLWRLTLPGTLPHDLAFVVLSACGVQTLFNFNPLIKLDGYYLLSDWLELPNLQQRAMDHIKAHVRWLFWGAGRPAREPPGRLLLTYGLVSWLYSSALLVLVCIGLVQLVGPRAGALGLAGVGLLGFLSVRGALNGCSAGEVKKMIRQRRLRSAGWLLLLGAVPALLSCISWDDRAGGRFEIRAATRCELRARVAGFVQAISSEEGERVEPGAPVARLEVPDLASRLAENRAAVREGEARLRLLEAGPRPQELTEQRRRVDRACAWRDRGQQELMRSRRALREDLVRLVQQIRQRQAELDQAVDLLQRARRIRIDGAVSEDEYQELDKKVRVASALLEQARAEKRAREALGTQVAEDELARRQKQLADARAALNLLQAGTRPEEIEAERARLARLCEESRYLKGVQARAAVCSPVTGVITTPHLKEKIGQYLKEGDLIAVIEEPASLEADIALAEQDVARVHPGQTVELKARALPLETFATRVDRVAPATVQGEAQGTVIVSCRLVSSEANLRPGTTGYARIYTGRRAVGAILFDRAMHYLRTEFWW